MKETFTQIALWAERTFGSASSIGTATRANEEMAELLRKLAHPENYTPQEMMDEVADVVIVLARMERFYGISLEDAIDHKMSVNRKREWQLDGVGHGQHIEKSCDFCKAGISVHEGVHTVMADGGVLKVKCGKAR